MEDDWDLTAVVRGCSTVSTTTKPTTTFTSNHHFHSSPLLSSFGQQGILSNPTQTQTFSVLPLPTLPDPIKPTSVIEDLHDLYKPFFTKSLISPPPQPNFSSSPQTLHKHQQYQSKFSVNTQQSYRGYYKCSNSKGCMARKQVERSRSDPGMFIFTYTAEHNHPVPTHHNSLAGSTRHKHVSSPQSITGGGGDSTKPKDGDSPSTTTSAEEEVHDGRSSTMMEAKEEIQSPLADEEREEGADFVREREVIMSTL